MSTKKKERIVLEHGTGGLLSQKLVSEFIVSILSDLYLGKMEDSAILNLDTKAIAMTTDSFVVDPIFFGNGNIGKISICGTVNDLAVSGAKPMYITLSLVMEEGLALADLSKILKSIHDTAKEANVQIVAGDTKVVRKGEGDKIFINTSGVGTFGNNRERLTIPLIQTGDDIIVTGNIGNHSIHILSLREGLGYESRVLSDCAPLNHMIDEVVERAGKGKVHLMRDLTRGGLGASLNEIAFGCKRNIEINLDQIPVQYETRMASDMLGVNPIYLANEGTLVIFCDPKSTSQILKTLKANKYGLNSQLVGKVSKNKESVVFGIDKEGEKTVIENLYGQELPRLC
ncbi:hydrogenase expression/formation protein HypE [Candidatus Woesebacteria bacterium RIFCSPLOWO2_01_FULL_37_19]|uniref:Hydrogenase expression/formation protein HypE n=1 Tax=Candidatus Woesebacteria bacterium RIFCSPLOWO2_01_FULL_37_19 TaxID=1802514 RepID=A0A1F8B8F1_9BACT|nr:MAG: hydrogenase expression/formation protein HypE [Candidatus Woesebacteria bacterium RIFCSPLOWO2_01_FULL_37_19]